MECHQDNEMLLSIVVPVYNGGHYLASLLNSLYDLNQVMTDKFEVILVDDGSTDQSLSECQLIAQKYPNIIVVHKENGGIASARNFGLSLATGKFICFCDQDDKVVKSYEPFLKNLCNSGADILISNSAYSTDKGLGINNIIKKDLVYDNRRVIEDMMLTYISNLSFGKSARGRSPELQSLPLSVWNCIIQRSFICENDIQFRSFIDFEDDWLFVIDCLLHAKRVTISSDYFYCWTINMASESHRRKYIYNFYKKKKQLNDILLSKVNMLSVSKDELVKFHHILQAQIILKTFFNATTLQYKEYMKEIMCLSDFNNIWSYRDFKQGGKSRYIISYSTLSYIGLPF